MEATSAVEPDTGTARVLARLTRPYEPVRAAGALVGLPHRAASMLVGTVVATCDETEDLLAAMPRILRSLAIATTDRPERCHGELRGPVLWSETMSARSASVGDPGLFVCATTTKAYDTAENRILKAALAVIERAGHAATHGVDLHGDDRLRRARHNEHQARHLLEHRALSGVPLGRISSRSIRRTATGSRRATYRPAMALLARSQDPLRAEHLRARASTAALADHDLLAACLDALSRRGEAPPLLNDRGGLVAGPIRYDHLGGVTIAGRHITDGAQIEPALDRASARSSSP
ncbi:MAG: hypothetical protein ACT452_10995 [Microthrixaceae bacterium]